MIEPLVITLREGVEAALIIAIAAAYLRKTGRQDLFRFLYWAFACAVLASFAVAWAISRIHISQEAYEGWTLLASAVFVFGMVVWMNRHARGVRRQIESKLQQSSTGSGAAWAVFGFVFLMVFREGVEAVLMLAAIRFDSSGVADLFGLGLGIGLAILFGISFMRGSVRINLRSFFQMTTAILMVVVAQLLITGLHELSEGEVLPSSREEMRWIGPIVRHDVFFIVVILALAATMLLMEWRRRAAPALAGLEGAMRRKAVWSARREKMWMLGSCVAATLFIMAITAEFIYAQSATALSAATPLEAVEGKFRVPVATVNDGNLHRFSVQTDGVTIRIIVIRRPDQTLATAFDACQICGTQGYYQKGSNIVCKNCASAIFTPTIGIAGGCNPIPIASSIQGDQLVIAARDVFAGGKRFRESGK